MQTALGFPSSPEITNHALARNGGVEAIVARFEQWMAATDSPIRAIREQPARDGEFRDIPESVHPDLRRALAERGIPRLYTHQAEAFDLCAAGKDVVVVTPDVLQTPSIGSGRLTVHVPEPASTVQRATF